MKKVVLRQLTFCPVCGGDQLSEISNRLSCADCDLVLYLNVATTASLILRCNGKLLLTQRKKDPAKGKLDFPGGFVEPGETLEAALEREILEELNYRPQGYRYFTSAQNRYPYSGHEYDLCDACFILDLDKEPEFRAGDDVEACEWKALVEINREEIAFESVWKIVEQLRQTETYNF